MQAWLESSGKRGKDKSLFKMISVSTTMTAIPGGISNNLTIEMEFDEAEGTRDNEKRKFDTSLLGIICTGSTPHNVDAGKVRRLCAYSRARVLSDGTLWPLLNAVPNVPIGGDWVVHCMGSLFKTTEGGIRAMIKEMRDGLHGYYRSQFNLKNRMYLPAPPTFIVYHKKKVRDISIAPGVVLKGTETEHMVDSSMLYTQKDGPITSRVVSDMNCISNLYNPYYMFFVFPNENQQPRPAFANSQTTQT